MTTLLNGLLGGLAVGLVATVAVRAIASDLPAGAAASVAYGTLAGLGFVAVELYAAGVLGVPPTLAAALAATVGWSALLCVCWLAARRLVRAGDGRVGEMPDETDRALLAYHLAFGVGLGLWVRLTWIT